MEREFVDLLSLQTATREALEEAFQELLWVKAEIRSLNLNRKSGHCYLDLAQTDQAGILVAQVRATIWRSRYPALVGAFKEMTGGEPAPGMEVLLQVQVTFHEIYGLSLTVYDIEPGYTLGAAELLRRRTLEKLQEEGLLALQKQLPFPVIPGRLAVISAANAAGYGDFCRHLAENPYGFRFSLSLFPARMQGEGAPESMIEALSLIAPAEFDLVLILRGGGSETDLACFDSYGLARAIARCKLPVITAIGHERDRHVADEAAWMSVKTPTALAAFLLDSFIAEDNMLVSLGQRLALSVRQHFAKMEALLELRESYILTAASGRYAAAENKLEYVEMKLKAADPRKLFERGVPLLTGPGGIRFDRAAMVSKGDAVSVHLPDGRLDCRVENIHIGK